MASERRPRRKRPQQPWPAWAVLALTFLYHMWRALQALSRGVHEALPTFSSFTAEEGWFARLDVVLDLIGDPAFFAETLRMAAVWGLVLLVLSIYVALRLDESLPTGVVMFMGYGLAALVMLATIIPAGWVLFDQAGGTLAVVAPPLVLGAVGFFLVRSGRQLVDEPDEQDEDAALAGHGAAAAGVPRWRASGPGSDETVASETGDGVAGEDAGQREGAERT